MGELQRKEEEMRQMFVNKVKETEAELKEKEREVGVQGIWVWAMHESWKAYAAVQETSAAKAQTHHWFRCLRN